MSRGRTERLALMEALPTRAAQRKVAARWRAVKRQGLMCLLTCPAGRATNWLPAAGSEVGQSRARTTHVESSSGIGVVGAAGQAERSRSRAQLVFMRSREQQVDHRRAHSPPPLSDELSLPPVAVVLGRVTQSSPLPLSVFRPRSQTNVAARRGASRARSAADSEAGDSAEKLARPTCSSSTCCRLQPPRRDNDDSAAAAAAERRAGQTDKTHCS